jgi:alkylation response protein AidB-like acyl-CoA dehydrogenase
VSFAQHSSHVLVSAKRADDSIILALVDLKADGVTLTPVQASNRQPTANVEFDVVVPASHVVAGLNGNGREALRWVHEHALVGLCALQLGIAQGAIGIMSDHVKTRTQFNKPLSAQQAVAVRAADQFVTTEAIRVTTLNAAWRMSEGFDARQDVLVAMYWATEGGHSIVIACQHLHGGIGADISYPVHRYFLWGIQISTELGGASQHLTRLGKLIASK